VKPLNTFICSYFSKIDYAYDKKFGYYSETVRESFPETWIWNLITTE
jgi:hypothetical protein